MHHVILIKSAKRLNEKRNWIGHGQYFVYYENELIGEFKYPMMDAARWMLEHGIAKYDDTMGMQRTQGLDDMTGTVGVLAKCVIAETESGPRFVKYKPWPNSIPESKKIAAE
jgi:hypothetical protein